MSEEDRKAALGLAELALERADKMYRRWEEAAYEAGRAKDEAEYVLATVQDLVGALRAGEGGGQ